MTASVNDYWDEFMAAVAEADQPRRAFEVLQRITEEMVGTQLFTAMTYDSIAGLARRTYSGNETAYPTGGFKPMSIGIWSETVIEKQQPYVSNTIEQIAEVFADWPLIQSLGCESGCNIPVVIAGDVVGTLNLLDAKGHYTPERMAIAMQLRPFAAIAFMAADKAAARDAAGAA
ncbi:GAF domain-containing protein [Mesorhizobium sp. BR1-1-16]|uniref:GAF domain-containing protein n=1 Tax=Mesorhizobium sp. BR1-1-16 TaxID=2876653 RepID=UPI001CCF184E|nr:GAF domain-containing protein [Mesorhizobium sp. BR1-1-16]MBZ9938169.1 GAF domain-containing protein [Mesorhizobium sp. BR1-1-16]